MAWWNSFKDLTGDLGHILPSPGGIIGSATGVPLGGIIGSVATGKNPLEDAAKGAALAGPLAAMTGAGAAGAGGGAASDAGGGTAGFPGNPSGSTSDPGVMSWLTSHLGDILKTGGTAAEGVANYAQQQAQLAERKREFDAQNQLGQNQQGIQVQSLLNRAPLADKGQYLAMNNAAPTAFKPRDYTQGLSNVMPGQQAQGGAAAQLAANNAAAANYKPGEGGVDTGTLKMILARLGYGQPSPSPVGSMSS